MVEEWDVTLDIEGRRRKLRPDVENDKKCLRGMESLNRACWGVK